MTPAGRHAALLHVLRGRRPTAGSTAPTAPDLSMRVIKELPNIRAALEWSFSDGDLEVGVQLAGALRSWYFGRIGQLVQAREWLDGGAGAPAPSCSRHCCGSRP